MDKFHIEFIEVGVFCGYLGLISGAVAMGLAIKYCQPSKEEFLRAPLCVEARDINEDGVPDLIIRAIDPSHKDVFIGQISGDQTRYVHLGRLQKNERKSIEEKLKEIE